MIAARGSWDVPTCRTSNDHGQWRVDGHRNGVAVGSGRAACLALDGDRLAAQGQMLEVTLDQVAGDPHRLLAGVAAREAARQRGDVGGELLRALALHLNAIS